MGECMSEIYKVLNIQSNDPNHVICDIAAWKPELYAYMQELLSQEKDLDYAEAALKQMFFGESTSLVDGVLINSAIERLTKCFEKSKGSRPKLDAVKVFRTYAKEIGEQDLTITYESCRKARNTVIAHDQDTYLESGVGIVVDLKTRRAMDVVGYSVQTKYLYRENQKTLFRLVTVAKKYIEKQKMEVRDRLIADYNREQPQLTEMKMPEKDILFDHAW